MCDSPRGLIDFVEVIVVAGQTATIQVNRNKKHHFTLLMGALVEDAILIS